MGMEALFLGEIASPSDELYREQSMSSIFSGSETGADSCSCSPTDSCADCDANFVREDGDEDLSASEDKSNDDDDEMAKPLDKTVPASVASQIAHQAKMGFGNAQQEDASILDVLSYVGDLLRFTGGLLCFRIMGSIGKVTEMWDGGSVHARKHLSPRSAASA